MCACRMTLTNMTFSFRRQHFMLQSGDSVKSGVPVAAAHTFTLRNGVNSWNTCCLSGLEPLLDTKGRGPNLDPWGAPQPWRKLQVTVIKDEGGRWNGDDQEPQYVKRMLKSKHPWFKGEKKLPSQKHPKSPSQNCEFRLINHWCKRGSSAHCHCSGVI